jgi:oxygen-independent coproporphyrinogen-3 oxidase
MFGLPGQTVELLADSVERALRLELPHYSLYGLKVEENTLFHAMFERNELPLPPEEDELAMYMLLIDKLTAAGFRHYEISNFAKPGHESRHNITYWRNEPYYGLGAGAHGYARGERHINIKGVQPYIDAAKARLPRLDSSVVSEDEAMEDFMMVGLRMLDGVSGEDFAKQFGGRVLEEVFGHQLKPLLDRGLLERTSAPGGGYRLSAKGVPLGNEVFGAFLGE